MNRRTFIRVCAVTPIALKLAPLAKITAPSAYRTYIMGNDAIFNAAVDPVIEKAANELGWRYAVSYETLVARHLGEC